MAPPSSDPVERGWELLEVGDFSGAEACLKKARRDDPDDAEVLCLAGAITAARGEVDEALEILARAAEADPEYAHPLLQAGELELYSRGDAAAARALAERALAVAQGDEEEADALLLRAEAELEEEEGDRPARATMLAVDRLELSDPVLLTRAGQMYLALEEMRRAERAFLAAIELDAGQADAHHGLGLVYEERGDHEGMVKAWLDTRRLDAAAPEPPWHLDHAEFERIAEAAMEELPDEVIARLENVPVLVEDLPGEDLVAEGYDPRLLGLFSGVPLPDKSHVSGQVPVIDSVHLYQRNIERHSADPDELAEEIRITVIHETAHFFGLDDEELEELGLG